ncbi:SAM-dependent methyltransferase [Mycobacterium antarcticum]|uniref:class I SAM-dependent methyltransferase n=1 Tax=Mycolicibacterium sp. TUM20983 TaxID=3023369 RepID=UPI0023843EAC|nr:class I SAM-dependent methyltransferase [Mycolicibacterium sp. TUM20983]GLP76987.1 SAM-dependent methyltransferase [Mycolicibacterium sp. TUM20983]
MGSSPWAGGRYESVGERIAVIAEQTVAAADRRQPLRGATVVDLACGTGSAALAAAVRGAEVTGVDLTSELIAIAEQKAAAAGHAVSWVTADAADTGLPSGAFDAAVSNMGIIFVEPNRQVAEISRLLKPLATLAISSWVRADGNPFFNPIVAVLGAPPKAEFTPDQWGDPALVKSRLAADFTDVDIRPGTFTWRFPSLDDALHFMEHESPIHVDVFRRADHVQRDRLVAAFRAALAAHDDGTGVGFDSPYVVVTATRR